MEGTVRPAAYGESGEFTIAPVVKHSGMQRNHNGFRVARLSFVKDALDPLNIGLVSGDGFQRLFRNVDVVAAMLLIPFKSLSSLFIAVLHGYCPF